MDSALESRRVSEPNTGLFHCGRCGAFFKAKPGPGVIRRCPECGGDPAPALDDRRVRKVTPDQAIVRDLAANPEAAEQAREEPRPHTKHHESRSRRKAKRSLHRLLAFVGLWLVLLGVIAAAMMIRNRRQEREETERIGRYKADHANDLALPAKDIDAIDRELIRNAYPDCQKSLSRFLQTATPETRSHWVCDPLNTLGPMTRFGEANPLYPPDQMPEYEYFGVLHTPEGRMVESLWKAPDGRRIEAVFQRTPAGWRLDWEEFVRYSKTPWAMFLVGDGENTGEFRLLARQRLANERKGKLTLSIVFHSPHFGNPDDPGPASPVFEVFRASKPGRKLEALFALAESGNAPFHAHLPSLDPPGMIRVRVRITRSAPAGNKGAGRSFKLEDVLAGHWLRIQADGIPEEEGWGGTPAPEKPAPDSGN
jgi:hypothetical protein